MKDSTRDATIASLYPALTMLTMQEIADRFGITRARVQQILSKRGVKGVFRTTPVADRFWPKVQKGDGCWEWQGHRYPNGYGHMSVKHTAGYAHRVSWELHFGPIPDGLHVCHHCDNPPCVRPDHLFLGTVLSNMRDRNRKGRQRGGPNSPAVRARLADSA